MNLNVHWEGCLRRALSITEIHAARSLASNTIPQQVPCTRYIVPVPSNTIQSGICTMYLQTKYHQVSVPCTSWLGSQYTSPRIYSTKLSNTGAYCMVQSIRHHIYPPADAFSPLFSPQLADNSPLTGPKEVSGRWPPTSQTTTRVNSVFNPLLEIKLTKSKIAPVHRVS